MSSPSVHGATVALARLARALQTALVDPTEPPALEPPSTQAPAERPTLGPAEQPSLTPAEQPSLSLAARPPSPSAPGKLPRGRIWTARALAAAADGLQIFLFPLFFEGFASPADLVLDAAMALALTKLVGFHWSYLPTAALELVPLADLAPTWTAAALLATAGKSGSRYFLWLLALVLFAAGLVLIVAFFHH